MNKFSRLSFIAVFLFITLCAGAQVKPSSKKEPKLPALITKLGNYKDSVTLPILDVSSLIAMPLKVYDMKGNELIITYYQCYYKRKEFIENEETGKFTPVSTMAADHFTVTPLPKVWITNISEQLKSGEEICFFDIIVKTKNGEVTYAPNLKIIAQ